MDFFQTYYFTFILGGKANLKRINPHIKEIILANQNSFVFQDIIGEIIKEENPITKIPNINT